MNGLLLILLGVFRVAFVGDPQVDNAKELEYAQKSVYKELQGRKDLDLVIVLGDLVNENPSLIAPSEASLDSLSCPWVRVNGNHDGPNPKADTTFVQGGVRFVLMDNVRRLRKGGYEGGFKPAQKQWLDSVLLCTPQDAAIVLCTHIPLSQSKGLDSLANQLSGHSRVLFVCGHTHTVDRHIVERGREELIAGASCGTWWRGTKDKQGIPYALMNCGSPRGYFTADFKPRSKRWYELSYKCIGLDADDLVGVTSRDGRLYFNVYGGSREGVLQLRHSGRWITLPHRYEVDAKVSAIIEANRALGREYRRTHKDEFLPMRSLDSPHLWILDSIPAGLIGPDGNPARPLRLRYRDNAMRFGTHLK